MRTRRRNKQAIANNGQATTRETMKTKNRRTSLAKRRCCDVTRRTAAWSNRLCMRRTAQSVMQRVIRLPGYGDYQSAATAKLLRERILNLKHCA
jgi:hypothetical protein